MKRLWTPICERVGIEIPIFGFAHDVDAVSAISSCGGYGVYGATRRFPEEITQELALIRSKVGEKVFGLFWAKIGIVTAVSKVNDLVFVQFLNAPNGSQSNGWYCEEDLEVVCK